MKQFGVSDCHPVANPIDQSKKLKKRDSSEEAPNVKYRELVGPIYEAFLKELDDKEPINLIYLI